MGLCMILTLAFPSVMWRGWMVSKFLYKSEIYNLWFYLSLAHYLTSGTSGLPLAGGQEEGRMEGHHAVSMDSEMQKEKVKTSQTLRVSCWS